MRRQDLAGYYAHCTALDSCIETLLKTVRESGIEENTILLFTSDHGDMLHSQGHIKKQRPWVLYDNELDPYQLENLVEKPESRELMEKLDKQLSNKLNSINDQFLPGEEYIAQWDYKINENGTVAYS